MGIKLRYFSSIILLLFFISCKAQKIKDQPYTQENYVMAYKNAVLYGCIDEKTNKEFGQLLNKYNSTASREVAILFHDMYNRAKLLGKDYSKNIKAYEYYGDLKGKTPIFSDCVAYAFSKEVDSIARAKYKKTR